MCTLTPGKTRGLQRCATSNGVLSILAIDHRNNLKRSMCPENPESIRYRDIADFKKEIVAGLAPDSSAVLLDPEAGAAQCLAARVVPSETGLVVAVDASGYQGERHQRYSSLLEGWTPEKVKKMGADAVKLLVYYHPDASPAEAVKNLVRETAQACASLDILFILEPLSYSPRPDKGKLSSREKREVVLQTVGELTIDGVDLLKVEFPLDPAETRDEALWFEACRDLSQASRVPWVLLSAGVDFATYLREVTVACQAGASGVAAGRAVWNEAATLTGSDRNEFIRGTAQSRMKRLTSLCEALASPVWDKTQPVHPTEGWYRTY